MIEITNCKITSKFFAHDSDFQQLAQAVLEGGISPTDAERRLVDAGLFIGVSITIVSNFTLKMEGYALVDGEEYAVASEAAPMRC